MDENLLQEVAMTLYMSMILNKISSPSEFRHTRLMLTLCALLIKVATLSILGVMIIFVWDRRCFIAKEKPAGVLMGRLEGITFLDSRGDGRYFMSNGKDQAIKLWDIRKMASNAISYSGFRNNEWDYRWMDYPFEARDVKHPCDQSVATYKGHSVLSTLIRCYFSPAYGTGQKYIYTGSHDSCVYIYDLVTGALVALLQHHRSPVRDCSWHPYYPMLVSSSWDGDVVKWEFRGNGEAPDPTTIKRIQRRGFY